ncbi:MAG: trans-2-enoyl-CoA reductase family protein [Phenylobacterium sp.]|jgi:enoyl-[acyl-carrier protein] reductase/trans-2-enoyl-CoA reductase (NAD+)|uniref:enoyl-ACP reductase FabV n=1 Tax=Phenylobacterium sp. TaxID=1871053 RepID=UPI001B751B97|nr:enoyl-ACP reductase FabV [Phenylobacterium sp.]MBP7649353.1 trans-2-enoyl-CoA reductase family protein [Phenylobacterium sp.]MBP7816429.1 trans-2-enoyl-CoA reductase family protein [Phenylobacterium sp.]MBP9230351.1 trans-2-enoyl-CoA reductase family protein [Phenylobacterium sp.]MBP9753822.1 trans-2-enoyl-CoA reductase family protein [Phenylobacterium sp.]
MIIEPRIRGFICTTAHPEGCAMNVHQQVGYVAGKGEVPGMAKRVLVLGCSAGYGLASRIVATFGGGADTVGVSFEKAPSETKTASAGWYNNRAFEAEAAKAGRKAVTLDGDAFSDEMKAQTIKAIADILGQVDLVIYSMAAPVRTHPKTGETFRSAIKPLGAPVTVKTLNTDKGEVFETELQPATPEETAGTVAVMGGEDWEMWIDALSAGGVLAPGFKTLSYTYIGSELTWPIYWKATLGKAKEDLDRAAAAIRAGHGANAARVVSLKAVVTQASSAIPVVPLYGVVLFKVMKEMGLHEGCIEQIDRLFRAVLPGPEDLDDAGRVRLDDWELSEPVQAEVKRRWARISTETLPDLADLAGFRSDFLKIFGFGLAGVDYAAEQDPQVVPAVG